jgi:hypothetical protein
MFASPSPDFGPSINSGGEHACGELACGELVETVESSQHVKNMERRRMPRRSLKGEEEPSPNVYVSFAP